MLTNNGDGTFTSLGASVTVGTGPIFVTAADLNGDGSPDLISANFGVGDGNTLTVLLNMDPSVLKIKIPERQHRARLVVSRLARLCVAGKNESRHRRLAERENPTGTNSVLISPATGNKFFRLRHP